VPISDQDWAGALADGIDKVGQLAISATGAPGVEVAGGLKVLSTMFRGVRLGEEAVLSVAAERAAQLSAAIPAAQQGRITMAVGLAEDATGAKRVLIATSEPRGYLRPGVVLREGEVLVKGTGHAEADIAEYARQNGMRLLEVGATRPICSGCASAISRAGAVPVTPLK